MLQQVDRVAQVERLVVVAITSVHTGKYRASADDILKNVNRVSHIYRARGICITTLELLFTLIRSAITVGI